LIKLDNICKSFDDILAVDQVTFEIEKGDIYGLLGPNGAGKTTTIRMLMGIIEPDRGQVLRNEKIITRRDRLKFGYLPEERGLYQKQKLKESLMYFGRLRGMNRHTISSNIDRWLERFNFTQDANRKIQELSKGNQQKVQFILALFHQPEFVILDEPFTGLDPLNQVLLKEIIEEKRKKGVTFIFSTHQMEQVERICTNICLMNKGKVLIEGPLSDIKEKHRKNAVTVRYEGTLDSDQLIGFIQDPEMTNDEVSGVLKVKPNDFINWLNQKVNILSFTQRTPSLEQIFIEEVRAES